MAGSTDVPAIKQHPQAPPSPAGSASALNTSLGGRRRNVYVMKAQPAGTATPPSATRDIRLPKKVLLARKIRPGETIQLTETPASITAPDPYEEAVQAVPETLVGPNASRRLAHDQLGNTLEHSVLGAAAEFDQMLNSKRAGLDTSAAFEAQLQAAEGEVSMAEYQQQAAQRSAPPTGGGLAAVRGAAASRGSGSGGPKRRTMISEDMARGKQERALARWDKQVAGWESFKDRMARQLGVSIDELVFSRAEEYREMVEDFQLLQKSIPPEEQHGPDQWEMSLRNAWTRYVPVGNRLSGIFCPIIVKPDDQIGDFKRIRNPSGARMRFAETQRKAMSGKPISLASTKQWRESEYYKKKQHKFRKQLTELWPHDPDFTELEVVATRSGQSPTHFQETDAVEDMRADVPVPEEEATPALPRGALVQGAGLELDVPRLLLKCTVGQLAVGSVTAKNVGTTALYYNWRKLERVPILKPSKKAAAAASKEPQRLFFDAKSGVVLPGCSVSFHFSFLSSSAGAWAEDWSLTTQPSLPATRAFVFSVKGVALSYVEPDGERAALRQRLERGVLANIPVEAATTTAERTPPAALLASTAAGDEAPPVPLTEDEQRECFNSQNKALQLFWAADLHPSFEALATRVRQSVAVGVFKEWDLSVQQLYDAIVTVTDADVGRPLMDTLAVLIRISSMPPQPADLTCAIGFNVIGQWADKMDGSAGELKTEMQAEGRLAPDPPPPEPDAEPVEPPPLTDAQQEAAASFNEKVVDIARSSLVEALDEFDNQVELGADESCARALAHFGLAPGQKSPWEPDTEEEEITEDKAELEDAEAAAAAAASVSFGDETMEASSATLLDASTVDVPPLAADGAALEAVRDEHSALNTSANQTGSHMHSSLVDGAERRSQ